MGRYNMVFSTPEKLNPQYVKYFLHDAEQLFRLEGRKIPNVLFDTIKTKSANVLGVLLIYKFFEYSISKDCFIKPKCTLPSSTQLLRSLDSFGFRELLEQVTSFRIPTDNSVKYNVNKDGVFIAPIILKREHSKDDTERKYRSKISQYYSYDATISFALLQCLGEIASNFTEHAVEDTKSILVATGNKDYFEIACADTGNGIISTLASSIPAIKNRCEILKLALAKGVTSKKDQNHMGYGLWLIDEFTNATSGEFYLMSEGAYLYKRNNKQNLGECPYWKGTVVYIRIPLTNIKGFKDVLKKLRDQYTNNKIQRV